MYITDSVLDKYIEEDVPYIDLTSQILGVDEQLGNIKFITREDTCICGTEEVSRILNKFDIKVIFFEKSGTFLEKDIVFLEARGKASNLHMAWKVCINILENASGIATRTKKFIDIAKKVNPNVSIITTRKNFPGTKNLAIKAIVAGGALPHRIGLSETILVFEEHLRFIGGINEFIKNLKSIREKAGEKKLIVEAHNINNAILLAKANVHVIQLDKFSIKDIKECVIKIKNISPNIKISAAGGVNFKNIEEISACGVDLITTSALYFGKPSDIKALIEKIQ